jgi:hypothetical protein
MSITVKGNITAGETTIKTASPAVKNNNYIHEKLKNFGKEPETDNCSQTNLEPVKKIILHRQVPIKTYESISVDKYQNVEDGELIKHYNKKSSYLSDMINDTTDSN